MTEYPTDSRVENQVTLAKGALALNAIVESLSRKDADDKGECRNWHLHLGVRPQNLNSVFRQVSMVKGYVSPSGTRYGWFVPGVDHAITNGDGWRCWGESVGDDVNDMLTIHVIVPILDVPLDAAVEAVEKVLEQVGNLLHCDRASDIPTGHPRSSAGLLAVLSTKTTWSAQTHLWRGRGSAKATRTGGWAREDLGGGWLAEWEPRAD